MVGVWSQEAKMGRSEFGVLMPESRLIDWFLQANVKTLTWGSGILTDSENIVFSADGSLLAVAFNYELILWDLKKGSKTKLVERKNINDVRFNPAGNRIVVGLFEGDVYKIDLDADSVSSDSESTGSESASE